MTASCHQCGEDLYDHERFCPACGSSTGPVVAVATPPDGLELAARVSPRTQVGDPVVACEKCGYGLAEIERFCPKCGTPRAGVERPVKPRRAWQEVRERLSALTTGRYEIIKELGRGGMAAVYLAHERALNRKVAIKVMRPDLLLDEAMVARFLREARTMANLHHPNIATVYAVESADDLHYFAMQYVPGRALDRIIQDRGALPVAAMQWVLYQAALGLQYAHQAGVIHRDIKPGNILIDDRGTATLTDFGIAKVADLNMTATTSQMGTPIYMSPEQCHGGVLGPASDQYALGNVCYEMLTGQPPFQRATAIALAMAITAETPKPIRAFREDCPPDIEAAVLKMLAKDPKGRFPNLTEAAMAIGGDHVAEGDPVRDFLASLAKEGSPRLSGRALTPRTPRSTGGFAAEQRVLRRRQQMRFWIPVTMVGIGVGAGVVGYLTRDQRPPMFPTLVPGAASSGDSGAAAGPTGTEPVGPPPDPAGPNQPARPGPRTGEPVAIPPKPSTGSRTPPGRERPGGTGGVSPSATDSTAAPPAPPPIAATPAVPPAPPPAPTPPPAPVVDRGPEIRAALERYEAAINARSLSQLRNVYPGLKGDQEQQWRDLFGNEVEQLRGSVTVRSVKDLGEVAEASLLLTLNFKPKRDQPQTVRLVGTATLKLDGGAWKILALTTRPE